MSRVTRFAARDPGPAARLVGFMAHLRQNGLRLGVHETANGIRRGHIASVALRLFRSRRGRGWVR